MPRTRALLTICFCAGLLAGLCSSLLAWQSGQMGLPAMVGVNLSPKLSPNWIYSRMIWGGLWGLAYFLVVGPLKSRRHWARKGLWISILPTAFQLLFVYPYMTRHGWFGLDLGQLTPLFIFAYNLVWGLCTGIFCRLLWGRG
jgi:hypothetical protein